MSDKQSMSQEVIALELVRIEKERPCTDNRNKDSGVLYVEYYEKIKGCKSNSYE